jgi:hypothetical protein
MLCSVIYHPGLVQKVYLWLWFQGTHSHATHEEEKRNTMLSMGCLYLHVQCLYTMYLLHEPLYIISCIGNLSPTSGGYSVGIVCS